MLAAAVPAAPALAETGGATATPPGDQNAGGAAYGAKPVSTIGHPIVSGTVGRIRSGIGYAPALAPLAVKRVIWAANKIRHKPYIWGGGHAAWLARGYDCSGTVSFALHGGGLLASPFDSSQFMRWQRRGRGHWITVFANGGHAWMIVAGMRLDTSGPGQSGPRWRAQKRTAAGFTVRHPANF
jgi:cell wall-associated NlpC family hydrolase